MQLSTAGHPRPVVSAGAGLPVALPDLPVDLPIGVDPTSRRHVSAVALPAGTAVCLYSDGLVERRRRPLTVGLDRLAEAMFAGPADSVCAAVMQALVGADPPSNDISPLVLHRRPDTDGSGRRCRQMTTTGMPAKPTCSCLTITAHGLDTPASSATATTRSGSVRDEGERGGPVPSGPRKGQLKRGRARHVPTDRNPAGVSGRHGSPAPRPA